MLNQIIALQLLSGSDLLKAFETEQLNALIMVFLNLHHDGIAVVEIFWGLWLLPFGLLVFKSGFVPRIFRCVAYYFVFCLPDRECDTFTTSTLRAYGDAHCVDAPGSW